MSDLRIEPTTRCEYCHPETCACPDYVLKLKDKTISSGDLDRLKSIKSTIEEHFGVKK